MKEEIETQELCLNKHGLQLGPLCHLLFCLLPHWNLISYTSLYTADPMRNITIAQETLVRSYRFEPQLCLLVVWSWMTHLTSLNLLLFTCKICYPEDILGYIVSKMIEESHIVMSKMEEVEEMSFPHRIGWKVNSVEESTKSTNFA